MWPRPPTYHHHHPPLPLVLLNSSPLALEDSIRRSLFPARTSQLLRLDAGLGMSTSPISRPHDDMLLSVDGCAIGKSSSPSSDYWFLSFQLIWSETVYALNFSKVHWKWLLRSSTTMSKRKMRIYKQRPCLENSTEECSFRPKKNPANEGDSMELLFDLLSDDWIEIVPY